jgi:hypothetical protein
MGFQPIKAISQSWQKHLSPYKFFLSCWGKPVSFFSAKIYLLFLTGEIEMSKFIMILAVVFTLALGVAGCEFWGGGTIGGGSSSFISP